MVILYLLFLIKLSEVIKTVCPQKPQTVDTHFFEIQNFVHEIGFLVVNVDRLYGGILDFPEFENKILLKMPKLIF